MANNPLLLEEKKELSVSVIITTYNRCEALAVTLRALGRQTLAPDKYEIVVVANGCSDATSSFLAGCQLPCAFKVFHEPDNVGISAARNTAIRSAQGRYIVFVSDDLIVP